jgi:hypothetical protein
LKLSSEPLGDIRGWDNVKLQQVWTEFRWHTERAGLKREAELSDYNVCVYTQLRMERERRGEQLALF